MNTNHLVTNQVLGLFGQAVLAVLIWAYFQERKVPIYRKYATFWPRFWTGTVDACAIWPVGFAAALMLTLDLPATTRVAVLIAQNLAWLAYTVVLHARYGRTVGKWACRVRVVDHRTEGPITWRQAWLREGIPIIASLGIIVYQIRVLGAERFAREVTARTPMAEDPLFWVLLGLPLLWFLAEALTMLTNEKRRALHDLIAGTVVVRTNLEAPKPTV